MVDRTATDTRPDPRAPATPAPAPRELGDDARRIGRFAVLERIGEGGMGMVVAAYDPELDRRVALKLVRPDRWRSGSVLARQRMLAEARAMAKVSHPNVVTVYEIGELDDGIYVAMEFVHGETIRQWLASHARGWRAIVDVFVQIARGIQAVHAAGLVHRDIKPDNLMVRGDGRAQVLDFGIARVLEAPSSSPGPGEPILHTGLTTEHGALAGTPAYMAPEQFDGLAADACSDQWSLCVSLFEALYGRRPFGGATVYELASAVTSGAMAPAAKERGVPPAVHDVVLRGLAPLPGDRWPSIQALADALARASGRRRRRLHATGLLAAVIATGGVAAMASRRPPSCDDVGEALARVWNDERRVRIGARFEERSPAAGADVWGHTAERIDAYGRAWIAAERDACESATVTHLQSSQVFDLRRRCLERGLFRLDAILDALEEADLDGLHNGVSAVALLPPVGECADVEALLAGPPPPSAQVAALLRRVDEIEAQIDLAPRESLAERLASMSSEVEDADDPDLRARFELTRTRIRDDGRADDVARDGYRDAYFLARTAGDHEYALLAAANVAFQDVIGDAHAAQTWLRLAEAELEQRDSPEGRLHIANTRGALLVAQGRFDDAVASFQDGLAELDASPSSHTDPDFDRASLFNNIASAIYSAGRVRDAVPWAEEAVAIERRLYGASHPARTMALGVLGSILQGTGDYPRAMEVLNEALALREAYFGPEHPKVANMLDRLAAVVDEYDPTQVEVLCTRALRIYAQHDGPDSPRAAHCHTMLGFSRTTQADLVGARDEFRRALEITARTYPAEHIELAAPLANLGAAEQRLGNLAAAAPLLERALALSEANGNANAYALANLGQVRLDTGRIDDAVALLERALALHESNGNPAEARAATLFLLARALAEREPDRARVLAARAREDYAAANPPRLERIATVDAWLAEHAPAR